MQTVEKLAPMPKKWGKKVCRRRGRLPWPDHLAMGEEIRPRKWRRGARDRLLPPLDVNTSSDHLRSRRRSRFCLVGAGGRRIFPVLIDNGRRSACATAFRWSDHVRGFSSSAMRSFLSPDVNVTACWSATITLQDPKNPVNEKFVAGFHKRYGADYPNTSSRCIIRLPLWQESGEESRASINNAHDAVIETEYISRRPLQGRRIDPPMHQCARWHIVKSTRSLQIGSDFARGEAGRYCRLRPHQPNDNQQYVITPDVPPSGPAWERWNVDLVSNPLMIASLALISVGLAIIFGMMRIIRPWRVSDARRLCRRDRRDQPWRRIWPSMPAGSAGRGRHHRRDRRAHHPLMVA